MQDLTLIQHALAVASGVLIGFSLGLIGGGGSILAVPLLLYVVGYKDAHVAIGTTALAVSATAFINLIPHWRRGHVLWRPALAFALPGMVGAAVGAQLGRVLPSWQLLFLFALLMVAVAITMFRPSRANMPTAHAVRIRWHRFIAAAVGVGLLAGFFGIGGGFLVVPALLFLTGMPILGAIGSSLMAVGSLGLTTAVSYAVAGLVDWRVALEYIAGGFVGGTFGAMLAVNLAPRKALLKHALASVISLVGVYMLSVNWVACGPNRYPRRRYDDPRVGQCRTLIGRGSLRNLADAPRASGRGAAQPAWPERG